MPLTLLPDELGMLRVVQIVAEDIRVGDLVDTQQGWATVSNLFVWKDEEEPNWLGIVILIVDEGENALRFDNEDLVHVVTRETIAAARL